MSEKRDCETILIRAARREDMPIVQTLVWELATYLKVPVGTFMTAKELERDGFDTQPPLFHCLLAELSAGGEDTVIGFAAYEFSYSMMSGRCVSMPALYIREEYRSRGVGKKLLSGIAKEAVAVRCSRLNFDIIEPTGVRKFYEALGAENMTEKLLLHSYRMRSEELEILAKEHEGGSGV